MVDLKALAHNKKFQVAAGGVAVAGGVVWYMRSKSGSTPGANTSGNPTVPVGSTGYVQGGSDTTGTDIASFLSNYSQSLTAQQNDWAQQWSGNLTDTLQAIKDAAAGGTLTPPVTSTPTPPGSTNRDPVYATVKKGWLVDDWIRDLQKGYGGYGPGNYTFDAINKLDPSLNGLINWHGGAGTGNTFKSDARIRIR